MHNEPSFSDLSFKKFLAEEKLMGCRCSRCDTVYLPPKQICTACFSRDLEWVEMPEKGKLIAFTCIAVGPPSMQKEGYNRRNPYCIGVVEVAPNIRVDARIEGVDPKNPEKIRIGMPMKADYLHREHEGGKTTVLAFRPA